MLLHRSSESSTFFGSGLAAARILKCLVMCLGIGELPKLQRLGDPACDDDKTTLEQQTCLPYVHLFFLKMSEEKSKGISLRTKRKNRPAISAPKQISGPIQQQTGGASRSNGGQAAFDPPPQRPQVGGKVMIQII